MCVRVALFDEGTGKNVLMGKKFFLNGKKKFFDQKERKFFDGDPIFQHREAKRCVVLHFSNTVATKVLKCFTFPAQGSQKCWRLVFFNTGNQKCDRVALFQDRVAKSALGLHFSNTAMSNKPRTM